MADPFGWARALPARSWLLISVSAACMILLGTITVVEGPTWLVLPLQVLLVLSFAALSLTDLRSAVAIAMLELAVLGASGQWTRLPGGFSGRITIDAIVTLVAVGVIVADRRRTGRWDLGRYAPHAVALAIVIPAVWMTLGAVNGNRISDVVADGNGHLFLAFTLAFVVLMRQGHGPWLRRWLFVVCAVNAVVTAFLIVISATGLVGLTTTMRYVLYEQLLVGNIIGYQPNGAYRLFLASGLYLQIGLALTTWQLLRQPRHVGYWVLYAVLWADVLATYTRGFWIGAVIAIAVVMGLAARDRLRPALLVAGSAALFGVGTLVMLPVGFSLPDYVLQRTASIGSTGVPAGDPEDPDSDGRNGDVAGAVSNQVRIVQARVLIGHILERPLHGHGFGTIADDYPFDDIYSYELAYLDLTYKAGLVGLVLFLSLPVRLFVDALRIRFGGLSPPQGVGRREVAVVASIIASIGVAGATNPYFLSAFGLMPVLATIAWLDPLGGRERVAQAA